VRRTDAEGATVFQPDALHRIRSVQPAGETPIAIEYTAAGRLHVQTAPNGATTTHDYDASGRIATITHAQSGTVVSTLAYTYDANGNRIEDTHVSPAGTRRTVYAYDRDDRLVGTTATDPAGSVTTTTYTLDDVGNRVTEIVVVDGVTTASKTYTYDARHQLDQVVDSVAATTTIFTFDDNGFQTSETTNGQTTTYRPNLQDRLATLTTPTGPPVHYAYDADGLRLEKRTTAEATRYGYDGTSLRRETNVTNNPLATYDWLSGRVLRTHRTGLTSYAQHDALKSPIRWSRADGGEQARATYDAWGKAIVQTGVLPPVGYTGYYADAESSSYYAQQRYYQPGLGRFNRVDPWGGDTNLPITLNKYLYANGNPLSYIDLDGRVGILTELRDFLDAGDDWLRNEATRSPLLAKQYGFARAGLAVVGSPIRAANLSSDLTFQALPRSVAPIFVDQASMEVGDRIEDLAPFMGEWARDPYGANARATIRMGLAGAQTIVAAASGDGGAISDLYSAVGQAAMPSSVVTVVPRLASLARASQALDQSKALRVGEDSLHIDRGVIQPRDSGFELPTLSQQRMLTQFAAEARSELLSDFARLSSLLTDSQLSKIETDPLLLRPFFGSAVEPLVEAKRMKSPVTDRLYWTGTSNKPQDWYDDDGFGFDLTGGSTNSILKHQARPDVDIVVTYDSLTNDDVFQFHKWLTGE
jgi:RHS repeat-associated protein